MQEHNVQETQERQEPEEVQVPVPKVGFPLPWLRQESGQL